MAQAYAPQQQSPAQNMNLCFRCSTNDHDSIHCPLISDDIYNDDSQLKDVIIRKFVHPPAPSYTHPVGNLPAKDQFDILQDYCNYVDSWTNQFQTYITEMRYLMEHHPASWFGISQQGYYMVTVKALDVPSEHEMMASATAKYDPAKYPHFQFQDAEVPPPSSSGNVNQLDALANMSKPGASKPGPELSIPHAYRHPENLKAPQPMRARDGRHFLHMIQNNLIGREGATNEEADTMEAQANLQHNLSSTSSTTQIHPAREPPYIDPATVSQPAVRHQPQLHTFPTVPRSFMPQTTPEREIVLGAGVGAPSAISISSSSSSSIGDESEGTPTPAPRGTRTSTKARGKRPQRETSTDPVAKRARTRKTQTPGDDDDTGSYGSLEPIPVGWSRESSESPTPAQILRSMRRMAPSGVDSAEYDDPNLEGEWGVLNNDETQILEDVASTNLPSGTIANNLGDNGPISMPSDDYSWMEEYLNELPDLPEGGQ
ncbi:hypothetical protein F5884DRAFT_752834 [Xylogone sp. PMI_703]|nr:hypothetical protein F5884DRAFT_752834 [Xylogone sp. PMI_703]